MYQLFAWVPEAQRELRTALSSYVKQVGKQIVVDEELLDKPTQFVDELLNLRHKFDRVIAQSFNLDNTFQRALKEAFEEFVNVDTRVASFLALYVDSLLKSGMKGMTETDVELKLDRIVVIFRHLSDKDIFEQYYQQHLAKRLLQVVLFRQYVVHGNWSHDCLVLSCLVLSCLVLSRLVGQYTGQ
jgi:cullin 3